MFLNQQNNSLSRKSILLTVIAPICFVLFFVGGPGYYSPRSYKYFWDLGHILNVLKGSLKKRILKVEGRNFYCEEQFDRINRIVRIKGPSAGKKAQGSKSRIRPSLKAESGLAKDNGRWKLEIGVLTSDIRHPPAERLPPTSNLQRPKAQTVPRRRRKKIHQIL